MATLSPHVQATNAKLRESKISPAIAKRCGIQAQTAKQIMARQDHYRDSPGMVLPYFDAQGRRTQFHRVRYFEEAQGFGAGRKYDMPAGVPPQVYFCPLVKWDRVGIEPTKPILITEGELKAICACAHGYNALGLGGVWSWKSKGLGIDFLAALDAIEWADRAVELCFDSDMAVKAPVRIALISLARELAKRGALCSMIVLPHTDDAKMGLDDYIAAKGSDAFDKLPRTAVHGDEALRMELREGWVYDAADGAVVDFYSSPAGLPRVYPTRAKFMDATGHLELTTVTTDPDGNEVLKKQPAAQCWFKDPNRLVVERRVFDPTKPARIVTMPDTGAQVLNVFRGLPCDPQRGDVAPMLALVDALTSGRADLRKWLLQWLAYPLQNPGAKLHQCVYVYSAKQGVGKSALGEVMLDIYGRELYGKDINEDDFFGPWNAWIETGLFGLCDELSFDGSKKSRSAFKRAVTSTGMELRAKYRAGLPIQNHCNFYFTGNSPGGLPLESSGENRRALVLEVRKHLPTVWFKSVFDTWRRDNGASKWLYHLVHRVCTKGFSPYDNAPQTAEVELSIESSGTRVEAWVRDETLGGGALSSASVWTFKQLRALYEADHPQDHQTGAAALSRGLYALGWVRFGKQELLPTYFDDSAASASVTAPRGALGRTEVFYCSPNGPTALLDGTAKGRAWAEAWGAERGLVPARTAKRAKARPAR